MKGFLILLVVCSLGVALFFALSPVDTPNTQAEAPRTFIQKDTGILLPPSYIRAITGADRVRVVASPNTTATKGMSVTGQGESLLEITLPVNYQGDLAVLSRMEAQEYVLRQLMISDETSIDTAALALDGNTLKLMAADSRIGRIEKPSSVFMGYLDAQREKESLDAVVQVSNHAISEMNDLAQHALDTQADVAKAGLTSTATVAVSAQWADTFKYLAIFFVALIVFVLIFRKKEG